MSLTKTMSKEVVRALIAGLLGVVYVMSIFCGCLVLPMWASSVADGGIWGLTVGAALFSVMLFVVPALGAGLIITRRNRALDQALVPLGLQGRAHDIIWREYHGDVTGREVTARFYRGPFFELGVSVPAQTRAAISRASVVIPALARMLNDDPLVFSEPDLAGLRIAGHDEPWLRKLLASPEVRAAVTRLVLATDDWAALQQIVIDPITVKLWLYRNKNLWRYKIDPEAARQWLADLLVLAQAIEALPPPTQPLAESALEKLSRSDWSRWIWILVVAMIVGLPLCGILIALVVMGLGTL